LEHTSDVYVRAYGRDLAEALEEAGKALFAEPPEARAWDRR
jgi:SHS2 domain-containing protein